MQKLPKICAEQILTGHLARDLAQRTLSEAQIFREQLERPRIRQRPARVLHQGVRAAERIEMPSACRRAPDLPSR